MYKKYIIMNEILAKLKYGPNIFEVLENGDHPLFLANVEDAVVRRDLNPLELRSTGWFYGG